MERNTVQPDLLHLTTGGSIKDGALAFGPMTTSRLLHGGGEDVNRVVPWKGGGRDVPSLSLFVLVSLWFCAMAPYRVSEAMAILTKP